MNTPAFRAFIVHLIATSRTGDVATREIEDLGLAAALAELVKAGTVKIRGCQMGLCTLKYARLA